MRYLLAATTAALASDQMATSRAAGRCLTIGTEEGCDLRVTDQTTWQALSAQFPADSHPDALVIPLAYQPLPVGLWQAPVAKIGFAPEPQLLWSVVEQAAPHLDLLLTDAFAARRLQALGHPHAVAVPTWGIASRFIATPETVPERDLDLLVVGNLHPAVQRERLTWLEAVAALGERFRVRIASGVSPEEYLRLLRRARLVLDLSRPEHVSRRLFEAAAAGALVLVPASRSSALAEAVGLACWHSFLDKDLAATVAILLANEAKRADLAERYQALAQTQTFAKLWPCIEERIAGEAPAPPRPVERAIALWLASWQVLYSSQPTSGALVEEVTQHAARTKAAAWHNLAAVLRLRAEGTPQPSRAAVVQTIESLHAALRLKPHHPLVQLNLVEALLLAGEVAAAAQQARHTLRELAGPTITEELDGFAHLPARFDAFRVEWDQAGWHLGTKPEACRAARLNLIRWRLRGLLNELTGEIVHAYEAVRAEPNLPSTQAQLGRELAKVGHVEAAVQAWRRALALNPLDSFTARHYFQALGHLGAPTGQARLAESRRRLKQAAPDLVQAESWFVPVTPLPAQEHAGLVSVVIPCLNQLDHTKACVGSVLAHSPHNLELVLIDNGSTDGTAEFFEELQAREGPSRIRVIRNETNVGFPKACNQGAAAAAGQYVLFLNNDTQVSAGWLEGMLRPLQTDGSVTLVGAVSNHVPPPQQVQVDYQDLEDLPRFAAAWRESHRGQYEACLRLSGFCLLARRRQFHELGGFDERFGLGFFDDDDLAKRVRDRGLKMVIAREVFVHHHGSATFTALGVSRDELLEVNKAKFVEKWGADALAGYKYVHLATFAVAEPKRRRVSLTMIVKNEEKNLPDCLRTVADLVDEIVIADTGSQDRTAQVASSFGAKVVSFPWIDHFAAARNAALAAARGDHVLWLDADDRLTEENRQRFRKLRNELGPPRDAFAFKVRSAMDAQGRSVRLLDQVRLFPRHPQVRWEYRIHEQILPAVRRRGGTVHWIDLVIDHVGYVDPKVREQKLRRNIRLLRIDEAERPLDSFTLFNLGWTLLDLGETEEALIRLHRSLEQATPDSSILRKLYSLLAQGYRQNGKLEKALELCRQGRLRCPDDLELPFEEALVLRDLGDLRAAERALQQLLAIPPQRYFASVDPELRTVRTKGLLAELHRRQGRLDEARHCCREGLAVQSRHVPLWLEWAETALAAGLWEEVDQVAASLAREAGQPGEAEIVLARKEKALKQFPAARARLERLLPQIPHALGPRVLLSHVLLEEGQDWPAAEAALRQVLALAPNHQEAKRNLELLRRRQCCESAI